MLIQDTSPDRSLRGIPHTQRTPLTSLDSISPISRLIGPCCCRPPSVIFLRLPVYGASVTLASPGERPWRIEGGSRLFRLPQRYGVMRSSQPATHASLASSLTSQTMTAFISELRHPHHIRMCPPPISDSHSRMSSVSLRFHFLVFHLLRDLCERNKAPLFLTLHLRRLACHNLCQ